MPNTPTEPQAKTRGPRETDLAWRRKYVLVLLRELLIQIEAMGKLREAGPLIGKVKAIVQAENG